MKSYYWKKQHEGVGKSLPFLSELVPETSAGTIEGVNLGQAKSLDTSFSSSAS